MSFNSHDDGGMPSPHDHVVFTDLDGAEGVLVDLNTKQYVLLNETASLIWRDLAKGKSAAEIAREMTLVYDVTIERAQSSVETTVQRFIERDLVRFPSR